MCFFLLLLSTNNQLQYSKTHLYFKQMAPRYKTVSVMVKINLFLRKATKSDIYS